MILGNNLGDTQRDTATDGTTLDDLFRRAGVRRPEARALIDPSNRESFTDGAPRSLSYAQADRAISGFAAYLRRLGLATDTVVALQLPNTVEGVIALLGVLRARLIAAPLPLLWRKQEMVDALGRIGAKALVTAARIGDSAHAELAMQVAAELFPIRYVCAFGRDLPDGVVPLDEIFVPDHVDVVQPPARPGSAAAHVAAVTFDIGVDGLVAVARNHMELVAGGLAPYLESGAARDAAILSAIPPGSFAGIALTVMPWLLSGGTLALHHGFDPNIFTEQCRQQNSGTIVLPGPALAAIAAAGCLGEESKSIVALWRSPERLAAGAPWRGKAALVDIASFGEIGLLAARRGLDGMPAPIRCGLIEAPRGAAGAVSVAETMRTGAGTLALRGSMVPVHAFPPGAEHGPEPHLAADAAGFVESGFGCRIERDSQTLAVTGPRGGITSIGGYRFRTRDLDAQVASADPAATIVALPDALLGQRLAGATPDRAATAALLLANGANPLIAGAFRPRIAA
ncbi:MAG: acyl--CoA ligase [Rhizobiales bacterium]|nr:acyl--CoA ligase [Hyphomicrobiales bacterium]